MTTMSQARYNDLVYITLKKLYFEPAFGEGTNPRECDIRVCMNMAHPQMLQGENPLQAMILSPTEIAPKSHTTQYKINTQAVYNECKSYMEDHWFKQPMPKEWEDNNPQEYYNQILTTLMTIPEDKCGG